MFKKLKTMNIHERLKITFKQKYLTSQENKWARIFDAFTAVFCFFSATISLYLLKTNSEGALPNISYIVVWSYMVTSPLIAILLYKKSSIIKIERIALVFFVLASSMNMLWVVMVSLTKT